MLRRIKKLSHFVGAGRAPGDMVQDLAVMKISGRASYLL
jgi:hypothetical protein